MNVLVTGGNGFIGCNFIRYVLAEHSGCNIVNLDKLTYAANELDIVSGRYRFVQGDICDNGLVSNLLAENSIDTIVNFAAETHVDNSIENPNIFIQTNVLGTANLLACANEYWNDNHQHRFLQVSTDEVYGSLSESTADLFTEQTPLAPHSPYSASKSSADLLVKSYYYTYGFPILITRCSNNYGPYQHKEKFIPLIISNALQDKKIPIYGDGLNIRDWIFVLDHCKAIWLVLMNGLLGEVYNVGANCEIRNIVIAQQILDYLGKPHSLIEYVPDRLGHDRRYAMDSRKIIKELDWKPEQNFSKGLADTIEWYRKRG